MAIILRTLGHIDLRDAAGVELRALLTQPKRLAVLVYLASTATMHMCRRDTLLGMFWPESDGTRARASLRQTLHFIRQEAGADIIATRGTDEIGVQPGAVVLDANEVDRLASAGRHADALAMYEGDFLDGFFVRGAPLFERWVDAERARLRHRAAESAWSVVEARIGAGDHAQARATAERAVRLSGDNEVAVRRFMTLLTRTGDHAGAAVAYQSFAAQLGREFGIGPSAETSLLFESLAPPRRALAPLESAHAPSAHASPPEALPSHALPSHAAPSHAAPPDAGPSHSLSVQAAVAPAAGAMALRLKRALRWATPAVLVGLAAFIVLRTGAPDTRVDANTQRVVVMPFAVSGGPELAGLRDVFPALLSARLDGIENLRSVNSRSVQAKQMRSGLDSLNSSMGAEAAARFGAELYVVGSISGSAAAMRVDVSLFDRRRPAAAIARARVEGRESDLVALADSATARLLAERDRETGGRGHY